jgi:hypothetical protein
MVFACASMRIYDSDYQGCYLRVGHVVGTLHLRLYLYKLFCIFLLRMLDRFFIHRAASATLFSPQPHFCGRPSGLLFSLFSTSAPLSIKKRMPPKKSAAPETTKQQSQDWHRRFVLVKTLPIPRLNFPSRKVCLMLGSLHSSTRSPKQVRDRRTIRHENLL